MKLRLLLTCIFRRIGVWTPTLRLLLLAFEFASLFQVGLDNYVCYFVLSSASNQRRNYLIRLQLNWSAEEFLLDSRDIEVKSCGIFKCRLRPVMTYRDDVKYHAAYCGRRRG